MSELENQWTVRAQTVNGSCPVDEFLRRLEDRDPQALLEFTGIIVPMLWRYGPDLGEPFVSDTGTDGLFALRLQGRRRIYRLYFSAPERRLIVLHMAAAQGRFPFPQLAKARAYYNRTPT